MPWTDSGWVPQLTTHVVARILNPPRITYKVTGSAGVAAPSQQTATAGETIPGGRAVMLNASGHAIVFDPVVANHGAVVGVAEMAASSGAPCVIKNGEVVVGLSGLTPGAPVWCGAGGVMQPNAPLAPAMCVQMGWAINSTSMHVHIGVTVDQI